MNLDRKLSEVLPQEREKFLIWKYRELRLVYLIDRITDRYNSIAKLVQKSLDVILRVSKCHVAGFLLVDGSKRKDGGLFVCSRDEKSGEKLSPRIKEILGQFLSDPLSNKIVNDPDPALVREGISNYLVFPMVITSQLEGAFLLANRKRFFDDMDAYLLSIVSSQLDNAVVHGRVVEEHKRSQKTLEIRGREISALYEMSLSLSLAYDFETLSKKVIESVMNLVSVDRVSIMLLDPKTEELKTFQVLGEKQKIRLVKLSIGKGIAGLALLSRKAILTNVGSEDERFVPFEFPGIKPRKIFALCSIPLLAGEKPLGVMNYSILSRKKTFSPQDVEAMSVAAHLISLALQRQQYYQLSIKDELTDLFTFRYFKERLAEEVNRCRRYKMNFTLVIFDLDHFKSVNDTHGHPFGNQVLQAAANVIHNSIRSGVDMPARFGGEEFALILPHTSEQGAFILAERIRAKVEQLEMSFQGQKVKLSISGGLATFPTHGDSEEKILKAADEALYKSKESGRNRVTVAS